MKWLKNFSIKTLFFNKKFAVSFSVVVAFVFWLVITIDQNPERELTFNNVPVSISVKGTVLEELGIDVVSKNIDETVSVTVNGPSYIVSSLSADDLLVSASVSHIVEPGLYSIDLVASKVSGNSGYNIVSISPSSVNLSFDYIDTKEFTVTAQAEGVSAISGLIAESPVVSTSEDSVITVKGPRKEIERISKVSAVVSDVETLSATGSFDGQIVLYDENNNVIDTSLLTLSKPSVKVSVPIFKKATLKLIPSFKNAPSGSSLKYSFDQEDIVTVKGPPETIDTMASVSLSAIDYNEISLSNTSFTVTPVLPDGVKLDDNIASITVTFDLSHYAEKTLNVNQINTVNLPDGLSASVSAVKNVRVCGPKSVIDKLSASDLTATVDLTGKTSGEYSVVVSLSSEHSNIWAVGTYNVSVNIK